MPILNFIDKTSIMERAKIEIDEESSAEECLRADIIVVGDIGHSPRMCYHSYSLASHGCHVNLIGYIDSMPHDNIVSHPNIRLIPIPKPPKAFSPTNPIFRLLMLPFKFAWLFIALFYVLLVKCDTTNENSQKSDKLLMLQNPPGLPTMVVAYLVSKIKFARLAIDWHNYTSSMLGSGVLAQFAWFMECFLGRLSDINFCVSRTMQRDLQNRWGIDAITLYDRPPIWTFRRLDLEDKHDFFGKFFGIESIRDAIHTSKLFASSGNLFTTKVGGEVLYKKDRPFLIVSSTSWTPDEDFSLLLDALRGYDNYSGDQEASYPKLLVVITGKGPLKEFYMEQIARHPWKKVQILSVWLEPEDYPKILACADIGVSLHTSTSGFDLPMKVVDMFGCGLPVIAKSYPAIGELVEEGKNGIIFDKVQDLKRSLIGLTADFPNNKKLVQLHENMRELRQESWEEHWEANFWPHFNNKCIK